MPTTYFIQQSRFPGHELLSGSYLKNNIWSFFFFLNSQCIHNIPVIKKAAKQSFETVTHWMPTAVLPTWLILRKQQKKKSQ